MCTTCCFRLLPSCKYNFAANIYGLHIEYFAVGVNFIFVTPFPLVITPPLSPPLPPGKLPLLKRTCIIQKVLTLHFEIGSLSAKSSVKHAPKKSPKQNDKNHNNQLLCSLKVCNQLETDWKWQVFWSGLILISSILQSLEPRYRHRVW